MRRRSFLIGCGCALCLGGAYPHDLIEPHMDFNTPADAPRVAITLDACMGATDQRILSTLLANQIPATIFATKLWLDANPETIKTLIAHPELFQVENHGARHLAAVIGPERPYGIRPAGTADGVFQEVMGGQEAITAAMGVAPKWYRDATALYTRNAMDLIGGMKFKIAGFSLNGDYGASVSAADAKSRIAAARPGDVIISHINHPERPAGAGVAEGILALKARGFRFVRLDDVPMVHSA